MLIFGKFLLLVSFHVLLCVILLNIETYTFLLDVHHCWFADCNVFLDKHNYLFHYCWYFLPATNYQVLVWLCSECPHSKSKVAFWFSCSRFSCTSWKVSYAISLKHTHLYTNRHSERYCHNQSVILINEILDLHMLHTIETWHWTRMLCARGCCLWEIGLSPQYLFFHGCGWSFQIHGSTQSGWSAI